MNQSFPSSSTKRKKIKDGKSMKENLANFSKTTGGEEWLFEWGCRKTNLTLLTVSSLSIVSICFKKDTEMQQAAKKQGARRTRHTSYNSFKTFLMTSHPYSSFEAACRLQSAPPGDSAHKSAGILGLDDALLISPVTSFGLGTPTH